MRLIRPIWLPLLILIPCLTLNGCTKANSRVGGMFDFDTDLKITFAVGDNINPDEKHTPSPLYVRFYELNSENAFQHADFLALYEGDDNVLGKELITKKELKRITPGGNRVENFVVSPDTRYVALFAEFFQYKNAKYKLVFPVTSHNVIGNTVRVEITDNKMQLRVAK